MRKNQIRERKLMNKLDSLVQFFLRGEDIDWLKFDNIRVNQSKYLSAMRKALDHAERAGWIENANTK